jgi:hypothetical protein
MNPLQQIRLSVLLEDVAANGGLHLHKVDSGEQLVVDVLRNPSVLKTLENLFSNPPPASPTSLSSTSSTTSGPSAANLAVFWWDFETGKSYSAEQDVVQLVRALSKDVTGGDDGFCLGESSDKHE